MVPEQPGARGAAAAAAASWLLPAGGAWRSFWEFADTRGRKNQKKKVKQKPTALTFFLQQHKISKPFFSLLLERRGRLQTPPFPRPVSPSDRCVCSASPSRGSESGLAFASATLYVPLPFDLPPPPQSWERKKESSERKELSSAVDAAREPSRTAPCAPLRSQDHRTLPVACKTSASIVIREGEGPRTRSRRRIEHLFFFCRRPLFFFVLQLSVSSGAPLVLFAAAARENGGPD